MTCKFAIDLQGPFAPCSAPCRGEILQENPQTYYANGSRHSNNTAQRTTSDPLPQHMSVCAIHDESANLMDLPANFQFQESVTHSFFISFYPAPAMSNPNTIMLVIIHYYFTDRGPALKVTSLHFRLLPHISYLWGHSFQALLGA